MAKPVQEQGAAGRSLRTAIATPAERNNQHLAFRHLHLHRFPPRSGPRSGCRPPLQLEADVLDLAVADRLQSMATATHAGCGHR